MTQADEIHPQQMTVWECIRVAELGLDGKPPVPAVPQVERRDVDSAERLGGNAAEVRAARLP